MIALPGEETMMKPLMFVALTFIFPIGLMAQDVVSAVDGSVKKVDAATKVVIVKATDGTEHTFHFADDLAIHGGKDATTGTDDALHGLKSGTQVAVHYTKDGGRETAHEIDRLGGKGLKVTRGTVSQVDRDGKKISIKTADGTEQSFDLTENAAKDTGDDIAKNADKATRVSVYYTEDAGRKTAHFIKKIA
jgi:Cu/Ag efflux protein CusF